MKREYKVGDIIYAKGTVVQIDENDHEKPYGIKFVYGDYGTQAWPNRSAIIDELPEAEPVKPVLPKKVVLTKKQAEIVERAHGHVMPACYISKQPDDEELLMNAYVNGYTVENEKHYNVKVPHTDDVWYYKSCDGNLLTISDKKLRSDFTESEIEHYGLQDCEHVEINTEE